MLTNKHPMGQFIESSEFAVLSAELCSNDASSITDTAIAIDSD